MGESHGHLRPCLQNRGTQTSKVSGHSAVGGRLKAREIRWPMSAQSVFFQFRVFYLCFHRLESKFYKLLTIFFKFSKFLQSVHNFFSNLLQTLSPSIINVKNAIDKSLTERDANIDKFCTHLDKDIAELSKEVKEVKQEAQNPLILDSSADKDKVRGLLHKLLGRMEGLQAQAFKYKSYQRNFKVNFPTLE